MTLKGSEWTEISAAVMRSEDSGDLTTGEMQERERLTFKVMATIHWQALKIWLRGAPFFSRPTPPVEKVSQ